MLAYYLAWVITSKMKYPCSQNEQQENSSREKERDAFHLPAAERTYRGIGGASTGGITWIFHFHLSLPK